MPAGKRPPVCDYEGSDYQARFWERGGREYEDRCEAAALKRLLPKKGKLLLELGAGAGRNTSRYQGFERIVLLDYSRTQLRQAQERLGCAGRYVYVAADIYHLPFVEGLFDTATMIRTLHHMADAPAALQQIVNTLQPGATFILEFANKRNLKAILRYLLRLQTWNPFSLEPVEFAPLNFDFHPRAVRAWLSGLGLQIQRILTVSYLRVDFLKQTIPISILAGIDSILQWTGWMAQLSPSVFLRAKLAGQKGPLPHNPDPVSWFKCPKCGQSPLNERKKYLRCPSCKHKWAIENGIYIFKEQR